MVEKIDIRQRPDMMLYGKLAQRSVGYVAGQVEITSKCGQRCFACDSWRKHLTGEIQGTLGLTTLKSIIFQLQRIPTFEHLTLTGGEPQDWVDTKDPSILFEDLVAWLCVEKTFSLQVNTNLCKPLNPTLWRMVFNRIRVSLDGVTKRTYRDCRGFQIDPEIILERIDSLEHGQLATMTCVSERNIEEIPQIVERINKLKNPPRKAMFLPVMGHKTPAWFNEVYNQLKVLQDNSDVELSFTEDSLAVRNFVKDPARAKNVHCYAGNITFHIKANGDLYPCCLIGGEAIATVKEFRVGNVLYERIEEIRKNYNPRTHYQVGSPCLEACQYKQLLLNLIAESSSGVFLTMP